MRKQAAMGNSITEGVIWKQLLSFFFPILLGTFFQQFYNTIDAMVVGRYVGKEALAAVGGATGTIINLLVGFFVGLASGATVIISQYYGAGRDREVSRAVHTAVALGLALSAGLMTLGYACAPMALRLLGTPEDIMPHASVYIRIYFLGIGGMLFYNVGTGILRAIGDSRRPMFFLIACCLVNIVLDLLFVVAFGWGVTGVAVATLLAQLVSAALVISTLIRSKGMSYQLRIGEIRFDGAILGRIVRIGLPTGLQSMMFNISNVLIQSTINALGTDVLAGWTAYGKVDGLQSMFITSYGVAITTFVGQNFGAQRYDRVRRSVRVCMMMAMGTIVSLCVLLPLCGRQLLGLFTDDPAVLERGMEVMWTITPFYWTWVCIEILGGTIRGTGEATMPMIITCVGVCVFRVIWLMTYYPAHPGIRTVAACYPISWAITSALFIIYYLHGGWMRRRIRANGFAPEVRTVRGWGKRPA